MITLDAQLNGGMFSQYTNFPFNSMVRFGETFLGAGDDGLFEIAGEQDNGVNIDAGFELPTTDLGIHNKKRIRFIYLGYETNGELQLEVITDQKPGEVYQVSNINATGQQRNKRSLKKTQQGRYFTVKVSNVNGADFSIDRIECLPVILSSGVMR